MSLDTIIDLAKQHGQAIMRIADLERENEELRQKLADADDAIAMFRRQSDAKVKAMVERGVACP